MKKVSALAAIIVLALVYPLTAFAADGAAVAPPTPEQLHIAAADAQAAWAALTALWGALAPILAFLGLMAHGVAPYLPKWSTGLLGELRTAIDLLSGNYFNAKNAK